MDVFRVPKREEHVRILLDDGRTLEGELFAAVVGPDGMAGRVVDRLNDAAEDFLAVKCGDDRFLLNKAGIVTVQSPGGSREAVGLAEDSGREAPVRLGLAGGTGLVGRILILAPPERSRVLDYLNLAPRFFPLFGDRVVSLVHKRYVVTVRDLGSD